MNGLLSRRAPSDMVLPIACVAALAASQGMQDAILDAIFARIGKTNRFFVGAPHSRHTLRRCLLIKLKSFCLGVCHADCTLCVHDQVQVRAQLGAPTSTDLGRPQLSSDSHPVFSMDFGDFDLRPEVTIFPGGPAELALRPLTNP